MKKFIGLVVILAALVLGSYYGMGLITERTIEKNVEIINQSNGLFVDIAEYDRGWYSSKAILNWRMHVPERLSKNAEGQSITIPAQDYKMQMPLSVYHGPIIFADSRVQFGLGYARTDLTVPPDYTEKFSNLFTDASIKPTLNLSLFVNYLNNSQFQIGLPTFKLISKQNGDQFEWYGMDSHVSISPNLQNIDGGITIQGLSVIKDKVKAILGKVTSGYDFHQTDAGIYLGKADLSMPSFVVTEGEKKLLDLEQFDVHSRSDIEGGLFNSYFNTSLKKMTTHDKTYGPARLEMAIKNLDAQVLAEINAEANKMQQGTDVERQQALLALLPQLPKLLSKGAQLEVSKLSIVVPEGSIEGNLLVSLPKGDSGNPFQLLQKVTGHGTLKIPATVLKGLITASVKQKLLNQPALQQAMIQQMKTDAQAQTPPVQAAPGSTSPNPMQDSQDHSKPMTPAEIEQQAMVQADQKLSAMVQSGLLSLQGTEYVIEVNLLQGQLSVNDKPFTPAMMQF